MDFHLSKEHLLVRKMYREFAETEVKPLAEELDEEERFPMETVEKMAKLGMMGIYFPKQYGGAGGDVLSYAMCVEELAKVCGTTAVVVSAHTSLCCAPIFENGTEEQKMKYLPDLLSGRKIGAFGLTEPGAGTDASGQQTIAVKNENGDYVLNGSKCFITNGNVASTFVVFAMTDKSKGNHGISAFIVESTFPGFSTGKHEKKMGIRGSSTCDLVFEDCVVPKENLLGKEGEGFKIAMKTLDGGRIGIASQALGLAEGAINEAVKYTKERVPAFVNTFGAIDNVVVSAGAGAIALGFPVVVDIDLGENQVPGALESCTDHNETVKKSLELRGIKIKSKELPIPVAFAAAFEGEIIRKADMKVEFWSAKNTTCELVLMKNMDEVEDHKLVIDGPDIDSGDLEYALATCVYVAGKKMQADFESVIERKIHAWFNYMEGVMHTGQRNQFRIRISKDAYDKGLRLTHFAEVLYHMITDEFDAVVDKCEVHLITDPVKATAFLNDVAIPRYNMRDDRLASMTDESVDRFFTCILCQSFAPAHCCVVTPERLGLCGAVSWLDAKAPYELNPNGPSQPIMKEGCLDERTGRYTTVNDAIKDATHGAVEEVTLYSIMEDPMTSCGCFECISGIEPMSNGFIVVNREYAGMTPAGMTFGELASCTGGGGQTPGYMGHGRHFISSKKFIHAEGGIERIVWMPKELKDDVGERLNKTAKELYGIDNFTDMIADETICTDCDALLEFLQEKNHPVLSLEPLM